MEIFSNRFGYISLGLQGFVSTTPVGGESFFQWFVRDTFGKAGAAPPDVVKRVQVAFRQGVFSVTQPVSQFSDGSDTLDS